MMRCCLFLSVALALHAGAAGAQTPPVAVDAIPAQPLARALNTLSRQTGLQFVYAASVGGTQQSRGTTAGAAPEQALQQLLQGTGLRYRYLTPTTVTIEPAETVSDAPAATLPAAATTPAAAGAPVRELDSIQVLGSYAGSLSAALREKRYADSVVDVIAAEDIGKLPAQNVAEALQRVPGVSIVRDRGEGVYVRVRGLGPNFQVTTLNGQTMAVNENVRTSGQTGRQFRYDTLPAELVSGLDVIKSPTADLDEGAIGGIVNVRTFRPLELGKTLLNTSLESSQAQRTHANDPRVSGLFNWVNAEGTFGMLVSGAYAQRSLRQDRVNEVSWDYYPNGVPGAPGASYLPTGLRPTLELEQRERTGVAASLQWRPSAAWETNLDLLYAKQTVHYDEYSLGVGFDGVSKMSNLQVDHGGVTGFDYRNGQVQVSRETSGITDDNRSARLSSTWNGDLWTLGAVAFHSQAHSYDSDPIRRTRLRSGTNLSMRVEMPQADDDNVPNWSFTNGFDPTNPASVSGRRLEWREIDARDKEDALQLDAKRTLGDGWLRDIKFGAKYRERSRTYDRADLLLNRIAGVRFPGSYFTALPVSDMLVDGKGQLPRQWLAPIEAPFWGDWPTATDLSGTPNSADLQNSYEVREKIGSAYAMTDFGGALAGRDLRGNLGVRLVRTEQTTDGHADLDGAAQPVHFERSYTNALPSFNAAWDVREDMVLRTSAAKVITRPDLTDLSSKLTFNSSGEVLTASGGNPALRPFEAWQYDLTFEWYIDGTSALTGGVFYKDISSFIQTQLSYLDYQGQTYLLSSKTNGSQASVKGVELAYQQVFTGLPAPLDGLGMQLNYTFTDSQATYRDGTRRFTDSLEGVARNTYNAVLFYEKGPLMARASYSWSDNIVNAVGTANVATLNSDAFGSLDANVAWKVNDTLSVFVNAINLTGQVQRQYVGDHLFGGYTDYGRTWSLGLRARF
ncbi:TonB-dependent receptor [Xanthomonas euvesicatoria pv. allii]|uniref:TonB-dependent receptor n=1 Tax=Xanthomonas euvesicatoria TaxID=456327 RepID=UPI0024054A89|nr:TonB-dependent receptor [Xanthomonas euvesicatoria]MCP3040465.1 TonB-dependent receptor [Xanthomonas euvesicatoria pv. allii]MCP3052448.1 TonB-dependent receptor [Xanthomonas euvesicatoria pv. allii]